MDKIKQWFKHNYEDYDITESSGRLEVNTKTIKYLVVSPHSGTGNRWLLRVSTIAAFDRWANSTALEAFFETEDELYRFLCNHKLFIYDKLLKYLSLEYDELEKSLEDD